MDPLSTLTTCVLILSVVVALLAGSVPFLYWKCFRLESKIEILDSTLSEFMEAAGLQPEVSKEGLYTQIVELQKLIKQASGVLPQPR